MTKRATNTTSLVQQISVTATLLLLLSLLLAACGTQQGAAPGEAPTVEFETVEPTDEALGEPTDEALDAPTIDPLIETPEEPLAETPEEPAETVTGTEEPLTDATPEQTGTPGAMQEEVTGEEVSLGDIADDPEAYVGQTVVVTGEVSAIVNDQLFRLNEGNLLGIGDEILVLRPQDQVSVNLAEDTRVRVTGTVRRFIQAEIEEDFGFLFDDDLTVEYENRPTIIADSIELAPTISEINDNPEAYIGNEVTVQGEVGEVIGARLFRLSDPGLLGGDNLLVFAMNEDISVAEGDSVEVTGTVERFDLTTIEREATDVENLEELLEENTESPMLTAQTVELVQAQE